MKKGIGILLNPENNDLKIRVKKNALGQIVSGFVIGGTTTQNQAIILSSHAGELRHAPTVGVGIENILLDNDLLAWRIVIRRQLENDGQRVDKIVFTKDLNIVIYADYR